MKIVTQLGNALCGHAKLHTMQYSESDHFDGVNYGSDFTLIMALSTIFVSNSKTMIFFRR